MTPGSSGPLLSGSWSVTAATTLAAVACAGAIWGHGSGVFASAADPTRLLDRARAMEEAAARAEHAAFTSVYAGAQTLETRVQAGETMARVLSRAGAASDETAAALRAISAIYDPRRVRPGQEISVFFEAGEGAEPARLTGIAFRPGPGVAVTLARAADGGFAARSVQTPLTYEISRIAAEVQTSIYDAAMAQGATDREVGLLAEIFGYDVDFQRDILVGDRFEMVFERFFDDAGDTVRTGGMLFASLETRRGLRSFYRFQAPGDENPEWYDADGRSARKFLMKTPINGARLSSGFGLRRHPILGFTRMHQGTDFAAPTGTPIMAAGDGVVMQASRRGGYGNYIRLSHGQNYETAYAHLSRYAPGIRPGVRVRQGQVIGFVGSTGASTGPHLHYEVMLRGRQINPMGIDVPTGRNLEGEELRAFQVERARIDILRAARSEEAAPILQEAALVRGGERATP